MKMKNDLLILLEFIHAHCNHRHTQESKLPYSNTHIELSKEMNLCSECISLADYSIERRVKCPQTNKPSCKSCSIKCYSKDYRSKIKEVMKFSGIHFIKRGRIDYLIKYFF